MYRHNFKIAIRNILKNKFRYSFTILSMAVGLFVFVFVGYLANNSFLSEGYESYPNFDRMAELRLGETPNTSMSPGFNILKKIEAANIQGVEKWAYSPTSTFVPNIAFEIKPDSVVFRECFAKYVNKDFFDVFSMRFIEGGASVWLKNKVVITESFARKVLGDLNPVGMTITKDSKCYQIVGVVDGSAYSREVQADLYFYFDPEGTEFASSQSCYLIGLLAPGVDMKTVNKQLKQLTDSVPGEENKVLPMYIKELPSMKLTNLMILSLVMLMSSLVFLAAFINFINLLAGSLLGRIREMTLRKTSGASQISIFLLVMTETAIVLGLSFMLALGISEIMINWVNSLDLHGFVYILINKFLFIMVKYMAAVMLITALLVAFWVNRVTKLIVTKGIQGALVSNGKHRLRNVLLGVQLVICFFFVGSAVAFVLQYNRMINDNDLYDTISYEECNRIFRIGFDNDFLQQNKSEIIEKIKSFTGVVDMLQANLIYPRTYWSSNTNGRCVDYGSLEVDSNYFSFCRIPKPNLEQWMEGGNMVIVNKEFAVQFDSVTTPLSYEQSKRNYRIAGVVDNVPFSRQGDFISLAYTPNANSLYVRFSEGRAERGFLQLKELIYNYQPMTLPLSIRTLNEEVNQESRVLKMLGVVFGILTLIALIIAMFGIYSAITLDTQHRQKEMAIRKVNGATVRDILHLFGKLYLRLVFISALVVFPVLFFAIVKLFAEFKVQFNYQNPFYWISLLLIVGGFVLLTVLYRLRRIALLNPAETIKKE